MVVRSVRISGFRNLSSLALEFHPGRNLLFGNNGSGKTSVLEALFFLAFGKSLIGAKRHETVQFDRDEWLLHGEFVDSLGDFSIHQHFRSALNWQLNDKKTSTASVGQRYSVVSFLSLDYNLCIEHVPYLRRLLDRFIFGVHNLYLPHILRYNRALKQKNHLLKHRVPHTGLDSWNHILSEAGANIVNTRRHFVEQWNQQLSHDASNSLRVHYVPALPAGTGCDSSGFFSALCTQRERETAAKTSLIGPHRDRYELHCQDKPLRIFSAGEKKKNLLLLYIAYIEMFARQRREYPVFLLDDYDTAVDAGNLSLLLERFPALQIIATSVRGGSGFDRQIELTKEIQRG